MSKEHQHRSIDPAEPFDDAQVTRGLFALLTPEQRKLVLEGTGDLNINFGPSDAPKIKRP